MKSSRPFFLCLFTFAQLTSFVPAFAENHGTVTCDVSWGSSRQNYTYVFSGTVTCQGKPCANAKVQVDLDTPNQGTLSQNTTTSADGHYLLQVTMQGDADDTAAWRLAAQAPGLDHGDPAQVEGSAILMQDETTVAVERLLQIQQG